MHIVDCYYYHPSAYQLCQYITHINRINCWLERGFNVFNLYKKVFLDSLDQIKTSLKKEAALLKNSSKLLCYPQRCTNNLFVKFILASCEPELLLKCSRDTYIFWWVTLAHRVNWNFDCPGMNAFQKSYYKNGIYVYNINDDLLDKYLWKKKGSLWLSN